MGVVVLILTIIGIVVAIVFGFLQVTVPFVKREVRLSKKFPFFELSPRDASLPTALAYVNWITRQYEQAIDACDQALAIAPNEA